MQGPALTQRQQFRTIPVQIQAAAILNMNLLELQQFIDTEAMENPALSVDESARCPVCGFLAGAAACPVCGSGRKKDTDLRASTERDYLQQAFSTINSDDTFDPFRTVASGTGLSDFLKQQARMCLGSRKLRIAEYLIDSLDEDGYFRDSMFETAEAFATAVPEIEEVLKTVQSFDPPGIGARNLRECLLIQLRMLGSDEQTAFYAERILSDCWDDFARLKLKAIAKTIGASIELVQQACDFVRENLTPHPTSGYRAPYENLTPNDTAAVVPDVAIRASGDSYVAEVIDRHAGLLKVDETYEEIYRSLRNRESYMNEEDRQHIREHVERVKCILDAISLRKQTLARVANYIARYQKQFVTSGPSYLRPLRQKDVAQALEVHESTICRAVANKYCKLPSGEVISFDVFFDSALPVRTLIGQLIAHSAEPISDGEIAKRLAEQGVTIARRTVAKYRDQLKVLPCQLRAA